MGAVNFTANGETKWVLGAFHGFRAWTVEPDGHLMSPIQKTRWEPGTVMLAECIGHPNASSHPIPDNGCWCGFYAFYSEDYWWTGSGQRPPTVPVSGGGGPANRKAAWVYGMMEGWGRTVPGDKGFRSAAAVPIALALPLALSGWAISHAELRDVIDRRYPLVPIFDSVAAMLDRYPLDPPPPAAKQSKPAA